MLKIGLVGYGRMGKQIACVMKSKDLIPAAIIDPYAPDATAKEINKETLSDVDVIIDFSSPDVIMENIEKWKRNFQRICKSFTFLDGKGFAF